MSKGGIDISTRQALMGLKMQVLGVEIRTYPTGVVTIHWDGKVMVESWQNEVDGKRPLYILHDYSLAHEIAYRGAAEYSNTSTWWNDEDLHSRDLLELQTHKRIRETSASRAAKAVVSSAKGKR